MSRIRFFDFGTPETCDVFKWLQVDHHPRRVDRLIEAAFELAKCGPADGLEIDTVHTVRDHFAILLRAVLVTELGLSASDEPAMDEGPLPLGSRVLQGLGEEGATFLDAYCLMEEPRPEDMRSIFLHRSVSEVDFSSLAEALLLQRGRWVPERGRPEIL